MARAQLIIASVVVEGRSKSDVARDYGVSRFWVQQLVHRYERQGPVAYRPRSRRSHSSPHAVDADLEDLIVRLRKELVQAGAGRRRGDDRRTPGPARPRQPRGPARTPGPPPVGAAA